jgi:hypothetical protein
MKIIDKCERYTNCNIMRNPKNHADVFSLHIQAGKPWLIACASLGY